MLVSEGSGQHEPPEPRARPQQQPKPACILLPFLLPPSLPPLLPLFIHDPQPHRLSCASQGDSSCSSHGDGCRAPACPMEEAQGNTLVVRIGIPDLQQTVSTLVSPNSPIFFSLLSHLCRAFFPHSVPFSPHCQFSCTLPDMLVRCFHAFPFHSVFCLNKSNKLFSLAVPRLTLTSEHLSRESEQQEVRECLPCGTGVILTKGDFAS
ncbi:SH3 and multiple ankyrin repeat domains protein 3 isoform X1 [Tachysurus ichikawai]